MNRTIFKYPLNMGITHIELPINSDVLVVHDQDGVPHIWVEVTPSDPLRYGIRSFMVQGTGLSFDERFFDYVGTSFSDPYVWHVYEKRSTPRE